MSHKQTVRDNYIEGQINKAIEVKEILYTKTSEAARINALERFRRIAKHIEFVSKG